jgi:hypothetical protein
VKRQATVSVIATRQVGKMRTSTRRQDRLRNALKTASGPIRWIRYPMRTTPARMSSGLRRRILGRDSEDEGGE